MPRKETYLIRVGFKGEAKKELLHVALIILKKEDKQIYKEKGFCKEFMESVYPPSSFLIMPSYKDNDYFVIDDDFKKVNETLLNFIKTDSGLVEYKDMSEDSYFQKYAEVITRHYGTAKLKELLNITH